MISRMTKRFKAGFTLIELMVVVAIIGILAAVAIPAFMKNARKAKTTEAVTNVKKVYDGARSYYEEESNARGQIGVIPKQFPNAPAAAANPAPALTTCCATPGKKCAPDPTLWTDAAWQALKFSMDDPHYYSYSYSSAGTDTAATFAATGFGDLDCDADYATFEMVGSVQTDGTVTGQAGFFKDKELE
jgi:prepilin-type N-terminal cleavage/methylation domain-containing protein